MAENESNEGKDLALQQKIKEQFEKVIIEIKNNMENDEATVVLDNNITLELKKEGDIYKLNLFGEEIANITKDDEVVYNIEALENIKEKLEKQERPIARYEDLGLPDIEYLRELEKNKKQKDEQTAKEENQAKEEEEKDDEKPELETEEEKDEEKEKIAKKYNVNSDQVVHISKDEKVTKDHRFDGFVKWADGYDDVYILPGKDEHSWKFIGSREGEKEEIDNQDMQIGGKNPDIKINRIDKDKNIEEIQPIAMYEVDDETAIAITRDDHGKIQALACRQEGGKEKEYWGSVIPEASGKNVEQAPVEAREIISKNKNSAIDLSEKGDELDYIRDLKERNAPIKVSTDKTNVDHILVRQKIIQNYAEDLMRRDGIKDSSTVQPGFYENKAQKVLKMMEENKGMQYEEAVERVENVNKREDGGRTPDQKRNRHGE